MKINAHVTNFSCHTTGTMKDFSVYNNTSTDTITNSNIDIGAFFQIMLAILSTSPQNGQPGRAKWTEASE